MTTTKKKTEQSTTHELVTLDRLSIDSRVQRREGVQIARAEKIANAFNPNALGSITLSRRTDGSLVVLDGAHRCEGCRLAGHTEPLHALVYAGLTLQQEAAMFYLLNDFKQPSFVSRMLAQVVAGEPAATQIVGTIESHGWKIGFDSNDGNFAALSSAERVYRNAVGALPGGPHPEVLDRAMTIITSAWRHDRESAHQMILLGLGQVVGRFGDAMDIASLATRLSKERPNTLVGHARVLQSLQGGTTTAAMAKVITGLYNKKRRTNLLPEWVWTR